ncbi:MAG TPA: nuclease-related domain-containing protein [Gaiellaceae bacterium]|nr:nuclease-related domain-containing protein [Gaiellaceae bacterium]
MREGLRRQERRETRTVKAHPRIGKLILALSEEPQTTRAWKQGAAGEQALGAALDKLRDEGFGVLHDRRIPGTEANIDHLVVGPAGVFVIDAKRYTGKIERRDRGWILGRDWRLYVNGRDQTKLVRAMPRQVEAVRSSLVPTPFADCHIFAVLCFVDSQWGLIPSPFVLNDVHVTWPKMLYKLVRSEGSLQREQIAELERLLALALPRA